MAFDAMRGYMACRSQGWRDLVEGSLTSLAAARLDAEAIAQALGAHLGALVDVSTSGGNPGFQGQNTLSFDNRFSQPTTPPEIAINIAVTVRYRLIH